MRERKGVGAKCLGNAGECSGMPGERNGVVAKCPGNAGECKGMQEKSQGNIWEWEQSARGIQGDARGTYGSG